MLTDERVHYNRHYLESEVRSLAQRQTVTLKDRPIEPLAPMLSIARKKLTQAYRELVLAIKQQQELSTAAEWLIDNFYIIQEQFVELKEDLPPSYYQKLPRLALDEFKGMPRIYELVQVLATISDNVIDRDNTTIAVQSFQEVNTLKIGELWGIPIMIRFALLMRLTQKIEDLLELRVMRSRVDELISELQLGDTDEPGFVLHELSSMSYKKRVDQMFLCMLAQRLQSQGMLTDSERNWFDFKFRRWNSTLEDELRYEAQRTSRLHLSIQNAISSLREVTETNWSDFVESCSVVERILQLDPSGFYPNMDFESRDYYRKIVERLSLHSPMTETQVAEQALLLTEQAANTDGKNPPGNHIGYYLADEGYPQLTQKIKYRKPWSERWRSWSENPAFYFSCVGLYVVIFLVIVVLLTGLMNKTFWIIGLTLAAAFFPALDLSIVSTNRILSLLMAPRILPKLKITGDIRDEFRTLVVVPTLFTSSGDVRTQFEALEIRALANPNASLQFALLSDFRDAKQVRMPNDEEILKTAQREVQKLNAKYKSNYGDKFYVLHRKRCWNKKQQRWMGWERKRGKLEEINRLLRNQQAETTYTTISGDFLESVGNIPVQYVITLDADTKLPPGSALELISAATHPLNRARVDESKSHVTRGYGIFQPRISITPKSANRTWFSRIFSGNVGIDPYTTAVSDIYQDLFGEGVFTGKGLYDVDVFNNVLGNRFPDNMILSHDLLESTYLRTALLSDIELFDDYPSTYLNYVQRNHRWIRGDWQILYWLFQKVPSVNSKRESNPTNIVSRWKIFDNLRRSLNPFFLLLFLFVGWFLLPGSALIWTAAALGVTAFPIYSSFTTEIFKRPPRVKWKLYLEKIRADIKVNTIQALSTFIFMPHQAYVALDAVIRTLWRMLISKERLLEWTAASVAERRQVTFGQYWQHMWVNIAWGLLCLILIWYFHPIILLIVGPIATAWMAAPAVAYELGKPVESKEKALDEADILELKKYARLTWQYFERYVTEEHSWLPPDNFQEEPYVGAVARTSPTNIGLGLVATYVGWEFGYITISEFLHRTGNMLESMKLLEKYKGHFFNWYSTQRAEVLAPRYISTVDSGNLAASLLMLKQVFLGMREKCWLRNEFWDGLRETVNVLQEIARKLAEMEQGSALIISQVQDLLQSLEEQIPISLSGDPQLWLNKIEKMQPLAQKLSVTDLQSFQEVLLEAEYENIVDWYKQPIIQVEAQQKEILEVLEQTPVSDFTGAALQLKQLAGLPLFSDWLQKAEEFAGWCDTMVREMDFSILYFKDKDLFSIGYNLDRASLDKSTYDQLATEARLASYIAIAKGDVPPKHWFRLSRRLTSIDRHEILLSWGGTMFEYLMPVLFMHQTDATMLSNTYQNVVTWQKSYGESQNKPWGYSESGYGVLNLELHYQYRAFGVPGLGLRRGLAEDYVVAPYASMLGLMVSPKASLENLQALKEEGAYGLNGFYEAIDYTSSKKTGGSEKTVVQMYMAHHQAMSLLAIANVLKGNVVQELFSRDPLIQACEVLLQERVPRGIPIKEPRPIDVELEPSEEQTMQVVVDHAGRAMLDDVTPRPQILSNGQYTALITHAGTGYSSCGNTRLTRWRADRVQDPYGFFFYIKDLETDKFWSMGNQPVGRKADRYDTWFHIGKVQTARVDEWLESFMEVCVSPEENIELRKLTFTNYAQRFRRIEVTSYAEVVLNDAATDRAHPAFSNLFVQTDYIAEHHALVAKRRPRSVDEQAQWLVHTMASEDLESLPEPLQYETDRGNFIGRGRRMANPAAMDKGASLSGLVGNVPDPIVCMRRVIELKPGEKKSVTFGLGKVSSREEAVAMADHYDNPYATDRVFELASIYGRVELEHIGMSGEQAHYFQKLAGAIIYGNDQLRAPEEIIKQNRRMQSGLWAFGISGDLPILLFQIKDTDQLRTLELLLKAHALWRLKGLDIDLVILNDHPASYINELQEAIQSHIQASMERQKLNQKGGIFVVRGDTIPREDVILLKTVARVVIEGKLPRLDFTDSQDPEPEVACHPLMQSKKNTATTDQHGLLFYNGYGGFTPAGDEYVIYLRADEKSGFLEYPPAPWVNVLANPDFGCITSESGSDYTWSQNSRENRLTPWSNDAVNDPPGEAIYIRDDDLQLYWSPTPNPVSGSNFYEVHHGFGYTMYQNSVMEIEETVTKWVPLDDSIKITRLTLLNSGLAAKKLSVYRYLDWVLGVYREDTAHHLITWYDPELQTIFARNFYNNEFADRVAFATLVTPEDIKKLSVTADRHFFIGRHNDLSNPKAVCNKNGLNNRFGAGLDPCAAFQSEFYLASGSLAEVYFLLGEAANEDKARTAVEKYRNVSTLSSSFTETQGYWRQKLQAIQVSTPVPEFNVLMNGWLQYQNIACRLWARSGFYQSGGAYGFRDQLQDVSSAMYLDPQLARQQILLHAAHQFPEGDVLHWWHPPTDRGTRTRISDDLLWMPYVVALYIRRTGDTAILEENVPFITARMLEEGEQEVYLQPERAGQSASLYEHCCLAIDHSLRTGVHGLPLIGAGDWNDGMNHVGEKGKGESVWLGFFLYKVLSEFIAICEKQHDSERVQRYRDHKKGLKKHLNKEGWDGQWYRRAFYDDGTPLGSTRNDECRIDAIAQAWSVISGAAPRDKAQQALDSADQLLVSKDQQIIRLLTPPFDQTAQNPGYIKGYLPGVRENGGQYTHAALWLVRAFAEMGIGEDAVELMRMLTPINHSSSSQRADRYRIEPYAVMADIYGEPPLTGMGGWSWYTGSAGWMYRVILESLLGVNITKSNTVTIHPAVPDAWKEFSIHIREPKAGGRYDITVNLTEEVEPGQPRILWDDHEKRNTRSFSMQKDGENHRVIVHARTLAPTE